MRFPADYQGLRPFALGLFLLVASGAFAQGSSAPLPGYTIALSMPQLPGKTVYLGHYQGNQRIIIDSFTFNAKGTGTFKGSKTLGGGIYLIGMPDRARAFEFLVGSDQQFAIDADTALQNQSVRFTGSADNESFQRYQAYMVQHGRRLDSMRTAMRGAPPADSLRLSASMAALGQRIDHYRDSVVKADPKAILSTILRGMREPQVPAHLTGDTSQRTAAWSYFKSHYWDGVDFWDDRILRTPFFEGRLDKYFADVVYPASDSVIKEIDRMLGYAAAAPEMQKFLLIKFVNRYLQQKYMWEDAVMVHLFEKYFAGKKYPFINEKGEKLIADRAYSLMANLTGKPASDIVLPNPEGNVTSLYTQDAPLTLLVIWDPTCGHCREILPRIDSAYAAGWKARGIKIFALAKETDGDKKAWKDFIAEHELQDWTHVYYDNAADTQRTRAGIPGYSQLFDVQTFPTLYVLDKDKRIVAKKVGFEQLDEIIKYKLGAGK